MIDTHCHLQDCPEPPALLAASRLRGMVTVGAYGQDWPRAVALAAADSRVRVALGLHPTQVNRRGTGDLAELPGWLERPGVVAVGETGLDDWWSRSHRPAQLQAFEGQCELARRFNLPVVVHVRDAAGDEAASRDTLAVLRGSGLTRGVLHCCNGHRGLVAGALEMGFHVSFAGNLTYPNARQLQALLPEIPRDRLLFETDAPYLAPVPHRGKGNVPDHVGHTLEFAAGLLGLDPVALENLTDQNAETLFRGRWPVPGPSSGRGPARG